MTIAQRLSQQAWGYRYLSVEGGTAGGHSGRAAARGEQVWRAEQLARVAQWRTAVQRPWTSLTEREGALVLAVSRGESNRDIAWRLHITERTVEFHVSNVLVKLALPARAAAVAWVKDRAVERRGV